MILFEDTIQGTLQNNIIQYSSKNHMRVVMWKQVNNKQEKGEDESHLPMDNT